MSRTTVVTRLQTLLAGRFRRRHALQLSPRPIVSFTFDDFPRSALTVAGEILSECGVRGTYYAAMGLLGKRTVVGDMFNRTDLEALAAAGHELACHTLDHRLCSDTKTPELLASCQENQRRIADVLGNCRPSSFAFPEGVVTLTAKAVLGSMYDTCRTIEPGNNRDPVDLAFLRAYPLYSRCGVTRLQDVIKRNQDENGWVILYTHDVSGSPSRYGCTPQQFREVVRCAVDCAAQVLPIQDAVKGFQLEGKRGG